MTTNDARRSGAPLWVVATTIWLVSCQSLPTGPSLAEVSIAPPTLRTTTGNPGLCCCRVVSLATNLNDVAVDVTVTFAAFNVLQREPFASTVFFIPELPPRQTRAIDAPGFLTPCDAINHVKYEVSVKGRAFPPG